MNVIDSCAGGAVPVILTPDTLTLTLPSLINPAFQIYQLHEYVTDDLPVEQIDWAFVQDNSHVTVFYYPVDTVVTIDFPFFWWTVPIDITVPAHTLILSASPENNPDPTQQMILTLRAQDADGNLASKQMVITVINPFSGANQPPVLTAVPDVTL